MEPHWHLPTPAALDTSGSLASTAVSSACRQFVAPPIPRLLEVGKPGWTSWRFSEVRSMCGGQGIHISLTLPILAVISPPDRIMPAQPWVHQHQTSSEGPSQPQGCPPTSISPTSIFNAPRFPNLTFEIRPRKISHGLYRTLQGWIQIKQSNSSETKHMHACQLGP